MSTARQIPAEGERLAKAELVRRYVNALTPTNVVINAATYAKADEVLKKPENIFVRYIRSDSEIMKTEIEDEQNGDYEMLSIVNGKPLAAMVAFKSTNDAGEPCVYIGWAKRSQGKVNAPDLTQIKDEIVNCTNPEEAGKILQRFHDQVMNAKDVEIAFHKKAAVRVGVLRAFSDCIIVTEGSSVYRHGEDAIVPRLVSRHLEDFITDVYRVFDGVIIENLYHNLTDVNVEKTVATAG